MFLCLFLFVAGSPTVRTNTCTKEAAAAAAAERLEAREQSIHVFVLLGWPTLALVLALSLSPSSLNVRRFR